MTFWIIIAGIALTAGAILGLALLKGRVGAVPPAAYDLQVYRDQLKEVDRDLARGVLSPEDAKRVCAEVSRRVLAADSQLREGGDTGGQPKAAGLAMACVSALVLLGGSVALYDYLGVPGARDLPLKTRIAASDAARSDRLSQAEAEARMPPIDVSPQINEEFIALMKQLRDTVAARPNDIQGLTLLMRNEARLGNMDAAQDAQARIIKIKGPEATAQEYATLADLMISAAGGYVSREAEAALRDALQRDPLHPTARYYLGLYLLQVDRPDSAFRTWSQLLEESRPDAPWVGPIRSRIEEVAWRAGVNNYQLPPLEELRGPGAEDVEAAQELSTEDRQAMIRGMVQQLSDRLASEGGSAAEWARLIGAYGVLGETDRAAAVWQEAQGVFAGHADDLARIRSAAQSAGVAE